MSTSSRPLDPRQISVNTSCKKCVFATYETTNITQIGCSANMLETFRKNGNVIDAFDEEKEFFVISNNACPYFRTSNWKHVNSPDRLKLARQELTMDYEVTIVLDKEHTDISATLDSLMEQLKRPSKINIIIPDPSFPFDKNMIKECFVPWTVEIRKENENKADRNHLRNFIRKQKAPIIVYMKAGTTFEDYGLFSCLEDKIIDEGFQFGLIKISDTEFITPKICYEYFNFMAESHIDSIMQISDSEGIIELCDLE